MPFEADKSLLNRVMMAESGGNPRSLSPVGAMGLMQLMPGTAKNPGFGVKGTSNPWDPQENMRVGREYLNAMLKRYGGDKEAALIAYNAGPGNADKWVASGRSYDALPKRSETEPYVRKILGGGRSPYLAQALQGGQADPTGAPVPVALPTAPTGRHNKLADALLASAAGAKPQGWGDLLNAAGDLALGYSMSNKQEEAEKSYRSKLAEALMGAKDTDALTNTLLSSGDPNLQNSAVSLKVAQMKPKSEIGRFRPTKQGVVDTTTGQIVPGTEAKGIDQAEYGTSTKAFEDKDGNLQYTQFSKAGGHKAVELPPGARWRPDVEIKDTGTEFVPVSKQTGKVVGDPIVKDVAGEAAEKKIGEAKGERVMAQPQTNASMRGSISGLNSLIAEAEALKSAPGLEAATGTIQGSGYIPTVRQETADAEAKLETLKSKVAFNVLQAMRDASKTGGALGGIAVEELKMLQNNLASLELRQGTPQFKQNLDAIIEYAQSAQERLRQGYRDTYGADFTDNTPAPQGGDVNSLKSKYGLE